MMLKEYGLNYEKAAIHKAGDTDQPVAERGKLRRLAAEMRRTRSDITPLQTGKAGLFFSGIRHKNTPLFTPYTVYSPCITMKLLIKPEVNSVNSKT